MPLQDMNDALKLIGDQYVSFEDFGKVILAWRELQYRRDKQGRWSQPARGHGLSRLKENLANELSMKRRYKTSPVKGTKPRMDPALQSEAADAGGGDMGGDM